MKTPGVRSGTIKARTVECMQPECPKRGRRYRLTPIQMTPGPKEVGTIMGGVDSFGLCFWPHVMCTGCGVEPVLVSVETHE